MKKLFLILNTNLLLPKVLFFFSMLHFSWIDFSWILLCPYAYNFHFYYIEDCFTGLDGNQPSELPTSCTNLRARFQWDKALKLLKKRSINHTSSCPPFCVPIPNTEDPTLSNLDNFKSSLVNFTLFELRNATNNFSKGM